MKKVKTIQLNIPEPCHEGWEQMTPCGQGRFCTSCQKTVIDFSTWSDSALYEFFSKNTAPVCGKFVSTQLEREIQIPHQPMSRLYRIAIACGLTLMFAQVPDVHAMVRQPMEQLSVSCNENTDDSLKFGSGIIRGIATDERDEPVLGAIIEIYSNGIKKGGTVTGIDGKYEIQNLPLGVYDILGRYQSYKAVKITRVNISGKEIAAQVNVYFRPMMLGEVILIQKPIDISEERATKNVYKQGK